MPAHENWSRAEVEALVADYFAMLASELKGEPYNKRAHNRALRRILVDRTPGAIEKKHQNVSAILIELGVPYIAGYKPLPKYQELLRTVIEERLEVNGTLLAQIASTVVAPPPAPNLPNDLLRLEAPAPQGVDTAYGMREEPLFTRAPMRRDYLKIEAGNASLGLAGEKLVLKFEHERLWRAGRRRLADRVEHVSQTRGDGLGFDILSFENDGRERYIEVKTTRFGEMTPFFVSRNEIRASEEARDQFQLCRVYGFARSPRLYLLPGPIDLSCRLDPVEFVGLPKAR
jgi:hypothetical protein